MKQIIEDAFDQRNELDVAAARESLLPTVEACLEGLERGELRVAEPLAPGEWQVNEWLKKAVLLYFKLSENQPIAGGHATYFDKVPLLWGPGAEGRITASGARVVPPATVRRGAYVAPDVVLMPSYTNIGAWIGEGTMVDTWATVGSCAQIGSHVHLSGGVGIGGVLEPLQAAPTIIEDGCFIGARSEVVEGVIVEHGSVISMGVYLGQSTPIYNRTTGEITRGRVPAGSVVVPGSLPAKDGSHSLYAAIIVKQVDDQTRAKVSVNELLRGAGAAAAEG
ncbi:MAG: 2,3,4,5-tetrahydropyridine-2,6-dicarboxylate N-succinyltransferase [Pseudomonadota bacterium]